MATFLASEDFHLVSNFIEASGADFVGNRLDLCLAVLLSFLHGAHEAPEVGRVFAVEYGVEAGVDGFFVGCSDKALCYIFKTLLACELCQRVVHHDAIGLCLHQALHHVLEFCTFCDSVQAHVCPPKILAHVSCSSYGFIILCKINFVKYKIASPLLKDKNQSNSLMK